MPQKNWNDMLGKKSGLLTAIEIIPAAEAVQRGLTKANKSKTLVRCICECGTEIYTEVGNFRRGYATSCQSTKCRGEQRRRKLVLLPQNPKTVIVELESMPNSKESAIEFRLNPKYHCKNPKEACVISSACNICCFECDRRSRCNHHPCDKKPSNCGMAKVRKSFVQHMQQSYMTAENTQQVKIPVLV